MLAVTERTPFQRIAVTMPPPNWFHGIAAELARIYRDGLKDLGIDVIEVPVEAFLPPDLGWIARLKDAMLSFRPELAIGLSHASYALICRMPPDRDGYRRNFFTEVLDLPTICLWDHAPMDLAFSVLGPLPETAAGSRPGAMAELQRALKHPRIIHWSRDRQQSRIMTELSLADAAHIVHVPAPALPPFVNSRNAGIRPAADVGFVGHLYQALAADWDAEVRMLAAGALGCLDNGNLWNAVVAGIDAMPQEARARLRLSCDETFFWQFAHRFILHDAQTVTRLAALGAAGVPVACIGNIDFSVSGVPDNLVDGGTHVDFAAGLPKALSACAITLDVLNPGFIDGYSHKPVLGFAAGGFVLLNRVNGFVESFGEAGEAVSWTSHADLAAKIDRYLTRPALRQEIGDAIRAEIAARHTLSHALRRVLDFAAELRDSPPNPEKNALVTGGNSNSLLARWRTHAHWQGAMLMRSSDGLELVCGDAWTYAAELPLMAAEAGGGHLILRLSVRSGRIAVTVVPTDRQDVVLNEVLVGPSAPAAAEVDIPLLWQEPVSVILRDAADGGSRALICALQLVQADPRGGQTGW